jgi:tetratricopeptide (TPR) repeat protein
LQAHQRGQLDRAELLYRRILAADPKQADALHLLGVIAQQRGQPRHALELIGRAIACQPQVACYHSNLAEVQRSLGNLRAAITHGQTALRLQPAYPEAHNNLGLAFMDQGSFVDAARHFGEALRLQPDFALAQNNLGNALREQGQIEAALAAYRRAVELAPTWPEGRSNLGQLLLEEGQLDEALLHCREAVRLRPDFAEGLSNLGNVLRDQGHLDEAQAVYQQALRLNPRLALTHSNLAQALQEEGRLSEAAAEYEQALALDSSLARMHSHYASLLVERGQLDEALARCRQAVQAQPAYAEAHAGLGHVLHQLGRFTEAIACFDEAVRLKPRLAGAHISLGNAHAELGNKDRAVDCYRTALRHEPRANEAYASLAIQLRDKLPQEDIAALERLLAAPELPDADRTGLHYGLAHVLDARGGYAAAAEHMARANALRKAEAERRGLGYSAAEHSRFVDRLLQEFTPEFFERTRGWGSDDPTPVFIVGLPRSGTTLTEQVLASHPLVFGAGELRYARDSFEAAEKGTFIFSAADAAASPASAKKMNVPFSALQELTEQHRMRLRYLSADALRIVDKMPDNYLYLGLLMAMFPRGRFIHCRRDLRDVALSCWLTNFKSIRWACALEDIAARIRDYRRLMDHWRAVLPLPLLEIDYEETVADLEPVARRLVDWVGLDWDPACLAFHQNRRPIHTASSAQVRQPIYKSSVQRWKHYAEELRPMWDKLQ